MVEGAFKPCSLHVEVDLLQLNPTILIQQSLVLFLYSNNPILPTLTIRLVKVDILRLCDFESSILRVYIFEV